ncbi:MAG: hypothetical protein JST91_00830 [Actinobacteria bacterium]|nr:hypothetical protein [Actinomycetota bacterium]
MSEKRCTKCDTVKPVEEFNRRASARDGLHPHCRKCQQLANTAYRAEHREALCGKRREFYRNNQDRLRDEARARHAAYRAADPMYERLKCGKHKAVRRGCSVEQFTSADLLAYWQAVGIDPTRCYYTGELLGDGWQLDHMTPLARGGPHAVWNLVPCLASVNNLKQDKTADEYLNNNREVVAA